MMPEPGRPATVGWLVLAGTTLVVLLGLWLLWDDQVANSLAKSRAEVAKLKGPESLDARLTLERDAVDELRRTIEVIKTRTGFTVTQGFQVPVNPTDEREKQPGFFFKQKLVSIRDNVRKAAKNLSIDHEPALGFSKDDKVPPDTEAQFLLTMLQLTEKTANIVLGSHGERPPIIITRFEINHGDKAIETGPESRPVLLREFPLTLKVVGSLEDLLWILHRLSQVDATVPGDYPLILQGLTLDSEKPTKRDEISQITATFRIAGMQFLGEAERSHDKSAPASGLPVSPTSGVKRGADRADDPYQARP